MGHLRQLIERKDSLTPLVADDPRGVGLDADLLTQLRARIDALWVALDVRELFCGRPEPGLLLFARGSPVGAIHDRAGLPQMAGKRGLVSGRGRGWGGEHECA